MHPRVYHPWASSFRRSVHWTLLALLVCACQFGCVQRRLTIRTNPPGALVYVDDYQIGTTPVSTGFTYYGTRKIRLVLSGYETKTFLQPVPMPWYEYPGLDFVTENLVPGEIRDERVVEYQLTPQVIAPSQQLLGRAETCVTAPLLPRLRCLPCPRPAPASAHPQWPHKAHPPHRPTPRDRIAPSVANRGCVRRDPFSSLSMEQRKASAQPATARFTQSTFPSPAASRLPRLTLLACSSGACVAAYLADSIAGAVRTEHSGFLAFAKQLAYAISDHWRRPSAVRHLATPMHKSITTLLFAVFASIPLVAGHLWADVIPPIGLAPGSQYQLIFVTAGTIAGTIPSEAPYNAFVTAQALLNPSLPSTTWHSVTAAGNTEALQNAPSGNLVPIYNTAGQLVQAGLPLRGDG